MQRRKVWFLLSIPAFILLVLLVVAETANQLIVNVLISGVRHPLWGVYELVVTFAAVGALPFFAFLWLRHLPRRDGDRFFDPFQRWLREGVEEEARRREEMAMRPASSSHVMRWALVVVAVLGAAGAGLAVATAHPRAAAVRPNVGHAVLARVGHCAPAPCAQLPVGTLLVTRFSNKYMPTDLSRGAKSFSDDGTPPFGYRWVRIAVVLRPTAHASVPPLRAVLRLADGRGLRKPNALGFDPACRTVSASVAESSGVPLCFQARGAAPGKVALVWPGEHLKLDLWSRP